jgi:hypothetical protein
MSSFFERRSVAAHALCRGYDFPNLVRAHNYDSKSRRLA